MIGDYSTLLVGVKQNNKVYWGHSTIHWGNSPTV